MHTYLSHLFRLTRTRISMTRLYSKQFVIILIKSIAQSYNFFLEYKYYTFFLQTKQPYSGDTGNYSTINILSFEHLTLYFNSISFLSDGGRFNFHFTSPLSLFKDPPNRISASTSIYRLVDTEIWSSITISID